MWGRKKPLSETEKKFTLFRLLALVVEMEFPLKPAADDTRSDAERLNQAQEQLLVILDKWKIGYEIIAREDDRITFAVAYANKGDIGKIATKIILENKDLNRVISRYYWTDAASRISNKLIPITPARRKAARIVRRLERRPSL